MKFISKSGTVFEGYQWTGNPADLPVWLAHFKVHEDRHHGAILNIEPYMVRVNRWVLRNDDDHKHVFPVTQALLEEHYTPAEDTPYGG